MTERISPRQFHETVGVENWRATSEEGKAGTL
jgi:hypothetical protein